MMKNIYFLALFFSFVQHFVAQTQITTSVKAKEVISIFTSEKPIKWAVPISKTEKLTLQWYERQNSFSEKEGIHTFVGYLDNRFVASLSIDKNSLSVEVSRSENTIHISTNAQGFLTLYLKENNSKCGVCTDGSCSHSDHQSTKKTTDMTTLDKNKKEIIANRDVLFVYRLALPISYKSFVSSDFNANIQNVKTFWANAEVQLNEIYTREIGVKFEIVKDEKLILQTSGNELDTYSANTIIQKSTYFINHLIGAEKYDLGVIIAEKYDTPHLAGLAGYDTAYGFHKAGATAIKNINTIGHEIRHMFSSRHTFTTGGEHTYYTEINRGQSIMSYGLPADFFSG